MAGARLADESAYVDQARRDDLAGTVDDVGAFGHARGADAVARVTNDPVGDEHVPRAVEIARGVDDASVGEQDGAGTA
jgi:hypothetical protein